MRITRLTTADDVREPVRVDDLVEFGRLGVVDRLDALERLIRAARTKVERYSGLVLVPGTFLVRADAWARVFDLPLRPITAVTSFWYTDSSGAIVTLTSEMYVADLETESSRVVLTSLAPDPVGLRALGAVELVVAAGYASPDLIPEDVRQMVMRAALLGFEHRGDPSTLRAVDDYIERSAYAVASGDLV